MMTMIWQCTNKTHNPQVGNANGGLMPIAVILPKKQGIRAHQAP